MCLVNPLPMNACDRPSPAQPLPCTPTRRLRLPHGEIGYDDTGGSGPLVLAIPGMGDLRSQYRALRPWLWQAGYRVVTMDIRGHGQTSAVWDDYSAWAVAQDALALLAHLQAGPAVILGNSFAAGSALWAAHEAPQQVRGVVLLGPVVRDGQPPWWMRPAVALGLSGPWRVTFWLCVWDRLFPLRKPADHARARAALAANLRQPERMAALRAMIGLSKSDTEALVARSQVPALVVMGSRDPDFPDPAAEARWLGQQLGTAPVLIDGAGHYPHLEAPEQLAPALLSFLARTAPVQNAQSGR
ncbi:MAG: alpha/beta hydrolase [Rhodoferax sp.]